MRTGGVQGGMRGGGGGCLSSKRSERGRVWGGWVLRGLGLREDAGGSARGPMSLKRGQVS